MRFDKTPTHLLHHHRKGKWLRTNNDFERNLKIQFTSVWYNISKEKELTMVTFKLVSKTETSIIYNYYPEGRETEEFGIICIDLLNNTIILEKLAAKDFERVIKK